MADRDHPLDRIPDIDDDPLAWDPEQRRFQAAATGQPDPRRVRVPAPPDGQRATPPPRRAPEVVAPSTPPAPAAAPATASATAIAPKPTTSRPRVVVAAPERERADTPSSRRPASPAEPPPRRRRLLPSRRLVRRIGVVVVLLLVGGIAWGYLQFNRIERVELTSVLASGNGTNYLIVGSDSRAGVDPANPNAGAILGDDTVGGPERSDTMLVLRVDDQGARMLSIPRDLWVTVAETGERSRINGAFNGGPQRLVATISDELGLPIHHYLEVDFVSFGQVVDAVGGITIDFPHPAFDTHSGLNVPEAGPQTLDGDQALAFVRSRFYTEVIDGRNVVDGTGDLGRVKRQQQFLSALMAEVTSARNPITLMKMSNALAGGMRIDSDLGFVEALNLLRRMRGLDPAPNALPVSNFTTAGGAQVLRLEQPAADEVLAGFGSSGATIE